MAAQEDDALALCYTSGTTGQPKGVVFSHRSTVLHALGLLMVDSHAISRDDVVMPVTGLFHVLGWGLPYAAALAGGDLVLPGHSNAPPDLARLIARVQGHQGRRRADRVERLLRAARRARPSVAARAPDRRRARAARADRAVCGARRRRRPGLGHDRDVAERDDGAHRRSGRRDAGWSSCACSPTPARSCRGTARRPASCRRAGRTSPPRTTRASRSPTAGSRPATSRGSTPTAPSSSSTAPRTS